MLQTIKEVFEYYTEDSHTYNFDIFHLFDTGHRCVEDNSGYHDSRHFELYGFNTHKNTYKYLGTHDGIHSFVDLTTPIYAIRIFEDGSTMIRFQNPIFADTIAQAVYIKDEE